MGEIVQRRLESMIQELEDVKRIKLFSDEELKIILKKRKHFENLVNGSTHRDMQDYKDYILFELELLEDIRKRRDMGKNANKKRSIDYKIINRVKHLYLNILKFYPDEIENYESYIRFCQNYNLKPAASKVVDKMLITFVQKPEVWIIGARWYFKIEQYVKAGDILKRAITIHKENGSLYEEAIKQELKLIHLNCVKNDLEINDKSLMQVETLLNVFFKYVTDIQSYQKVLNLLDKFEFTKDLQNVLLKYLHSKHFNNELTWHILAQNEVKNTEEWNYFLKNASLKYEEGLEKLDDPLKKQKLWYFYLDFLIEIYNEYKDGLCRESLLKALEDAHNSSSTKIFNLKCDHYLFWAKIVDMDEKSEIFGKALIHYPNSLDIFKNFIKVEISKDSCDHIERIFNEAKHSLAQSELFDIWKIYKKYHLVTSDKSTIKSIFESNVQGKLALKVRPEYILWLFENEGIAAARKIYDELSNQLPFCKEIHQTMLEIETKNKTIDFGICQKIHILSCYQFGEKELDVWLDYIKFLLQIKMDNYHEIIQQTADSAEIGRAHV